MRRRLLLTLIFIAAVCGAASAADDGPALAGREEISLEPAGKERMAPASAGPDRTPAPRVIIDINDEALPRPAPAEEIEPAAAPEAPVEETSPAEEAVPAEEAAVRQEAVPEAPAEEAVLAPQGPVPVQESEAQIETRAVITAGPQPPAEAVRPVPRKKAFPEIKFTMPWQAKPKKELTQEEEIDKKIQGRRFGGETGFTTVTTYRNKGIKASGAGAGEISGESVPAMLDIHDCIKIAEANNIQALVAKKSIKLAEMRLFEARRNLLPSATIVVERSKGTVSGNDYLGRKQYIEGQQPLFHGGELYFAMKQAEANLQIAKNDYNRVNNELILQVKKAYYTLEKARENSVLQNSLSKEVEKMYGVSSKGYEAGAVARVEYLNVSSQASQVKYQLASADGDVSIAGLILRQAMNVNPREKFDIIPSPELKKYRQDFEKTMQDAFMNRPEIKANSLMITYYSYGRGIANAKSLPKVDLLGQWGLAWEDFCTGSEDLEGREPDRKLGPQWYAGIKVGVPFAGSTAEYSYTREEWQPVVQTVQGTEATVNSFKFKILDRLDMYSDKQLADIDYDRSRQEMNKTRNDVTLEVREGCFNYEKALIQLETAASKVKYQEADSELMRMKRGMDEVQDSNVIDSLIKLAQEKFGYVQAVTDCKISLAALEKAVGVENYFENR